jgi:putative endonuclease
MFTVYAISSLVKTFIYVGMTEKLTERLVRHNKGFVRSTKRYAPFNLIYTENCETGQQAREREKFLKSTSGKRFLNPLIEKKSGGIVI